MEMNEISGVIVDKAIHIHRGLGPGLLELVYHRVLTYELRKAGLLAKTEVPIPVTWDAHTNGESFRVELVVNDLVLVELKSLERTSSLHRKQTITYIKLAKLPLGLLINFGAELLKNDLHRLAD